MKYLFTWIASCLAMTVFSATPLEKNRWHDFEGLVADKVAHLSIYVEDNGKLVGSFCYAGKKPAHTVQGSMEGDRLQLLIMNEQKVVARFDARITSSDADRMEGDWSNDATKDVFIVKLTYIASVGGDANHRYTAIDLPDSVAENFMQLAVAKILARDKQWVVNHTFYPLETSLLGKKGITIRNAAQLLSLYDKVFYPAYLSRLRSVCFCGLFHNYRGLMVGRGELWIGQVPAGVGKKPRLVINGVVN
jgi:hypothetical protein